MSDSWVKLNTSCPFCKDSKRSLWIHYGCGSYVEINKKGYIRCQRNDCNFHIFSTFLANVLWRCETHSGEKKIDQISYVTNILTMINGAFYNNDTFFSTSEIIEILSKCQKEYNMK